jgi:hypothetical protein
VENDDKAAESSFLKIFDIQPQIKDSSAFATINSINITINYTPPVPHAKIRGEIEDVIRTLGSYFLLFPRIDEVMYVGELPHELFQIKVFLVNGKPIKIFSLLGEIWFIVRLEEGLYE